MTKKITFVTMALVTVLMLLVTCVPVANADVAPPTLTATLAAGQSVIATQTVTIPTAYPMGDVVFSFDCTGSMGTTIAAAKADALDIMSYLSTTTGVNLQYGVASYMDYPHTYIICGGTLAKYGNLTSGDYAYALNQLITADTSAVAGAIGALSLGEGGDNPQDYTRVMYESYADPSIAWRAGAARILVNFGDEVPHDCNLNASIYSSKPAWCTGGDPGRDAVMGTGDDLVLLTVLAGMAANNVKMIECQMQDYALDYWTYWTGITGGNAYLATSATLKSDVETAITTALKVPTVNGLHLKASAGYDAWLASVTPATFDNVQPGTAVDFSSTIKVPAGTKPGTYSFTISALDSAGVSYGEQAVTITVPKHDQTITVTAPTTATYGDTPITITASSDSTLPVTLTLVSGPGSLSGNTLTILGAGTIVVEATQAGDDTYNAATPVDFTIVVNKANQVITVAPVAPASAVYGSTFPVAATGGGSGNTVTITTDGAVCTGSGSGSATITMARSTGTGKVSFNQAGNTNYNAASTVTEPVTALKATPTVTLTSNKNPASFLLGLLGDKVTFTATVKAPGLGTATGTVTFYSGTKKLGTGTLGSTGTTTYSTCAGSLGGLLGLGQHLITAVYSGDANFNGNTSNTVNQKVSLLCGK